MAPPESLDLPPHPEPPTDLHQRSLPLVETDADWYRVYGEQYAPIYFGRTGRNRFDAPGSEFGALYAGADAYSAFIETFGHTTGFRLVHANELRVRHLARLTVRYPLKLVDLTGGGLVRIGADARICTGEYGLAQRWSLALYGHPLSPHGLLYGSRHDPSRQFVVIFDRAAHLLDPVPLGSFADPALRSLLADVLDHYRFGLLGDLSPVLSDEAAPDWT